MQYHPILWPFNNPPVFGDVEQIAFLKERSKVLGGERPLYQIHWEFGQIGTGTREGKFYPCNAKYTDAVRDYVPCPVCGRLHKIVITGINSTLLQQGLIEAENLVKEFDCWNCSTEFITDEELYVFVKTEQNYLDLC